MIVQHPGSDDPQVSERQYDAINEAIGDLSNQAHRGQLKEDWTEATLSTPHGQPIELKNRRPLG